MYKRQVEGGGTKPGSGVRLAVTVRSSYFVCIGLFCVCLLETVLRLLAGEFFAALCNEMNNTSITFSSTRFAPRPPRGRCGSKLANFPTNGRNFGPQTFPKEFTRGLPLCLTVGCWLLETFFGAAASAWLSFKKLHLGFARRANTRLVD